MHSLNHVRNFSQFARQIVWNIWDVLIGVYPAVHVLVWLFGVFFFKEMLNLIGSKVIFDW